MTHIANVLLDLADHAHHDDTATNLSAVRGDGPCLWLAGDEAPAVERLTADNQADPGRYGNHRRFALSHLVDLPGDEDDEVDVEGLARDGDWLWVVGSHSLARKKIKDKHDDEKALRRLATIRRDDNRYILARIPVVVGDDGLPTLVRSTGDDQDSRRSSILGGPGGPSLLDHLKDDSLLAPFLGIPGKDNGFDVEGLAAFDDRLLVGLRGPVLRGWAVVLELRAYADDDPTRLRLRELGDGRSYRTHVLDLGGLGVRDLAAYGDDLLLLAGPTQDLDGPVRVHRWRGAAKATDSEVVRREEVPVLIDLPYGVGCDHPEGFTLFGPPGDRDARLLVVHDSPSDDRLVGDGAVCADVVVLPAP